MSDPAPHDPSAWEYRRLVVAGHLTADDPNPEHHDLGSAEGQLRMISRLDEVFRGRGWTLLGVEVVEDADRGRWLNVSIKRPRAAAGQPQDPASGRPGPPAGENTDPVQPAAAKPTTRLDIERAA